MIEYFTSQLTSVINSDRADPLVFYIVGGRVEYCKKSEIDSLQESLSYIENRTQGVIELPVFQRK